MVMHGIAYRINGFGTLSLGQRYALLNNGSGELDGPYATK